MLALYRQCCLEIRAQQHLIYILSLHRLSTLEAEELADFYKDIPPLLHYCPQVHIMKQRMMAMQQEQMQQQYPGQVGVSPEQRAQGMLLLSLYYSYDVILAAN